MDETVEKLPLFQAGDLWVDFENAEVRLKGQPIQLTPTELRLLYHLMTHAGQVVSSHFLATAAGGGEQAPYPEPQAVNTDVNRLCSKLGDTADNFEYISRIYGIGYKFIKPVTTGARASPEPTDTPGDRVNTSPASPTLSFPVREHSTINAESTPGGADMEDTGEVRELWGQRFNIVENGLDEGQVTTYVNGLLERFNALAEEHEHLAPLRQLAERTVKEADKLAAEIQQNAQSEAEAEAARIRAKAQEQAEKITAEAESQAQAKAQSILSEAQEEARRIQAQVKALGRNAYTKLLADLERVTTGIEAVVQETEVEVAEPASTQAEAEGEPTEQEPKAERETQTPPEEPRPEPATTTNEVELTVAPFNSVDDLLNFRQVLAAPQDIQLLSTRSLGDGHRVQFQLRVSAGYKLNEHLRLNIPGVIITDYGSKVEAQLPQPGK